MWYVIQTSLFCWVLLNGCGGEREVSPQVCALIGNRCNWFAPAQTDNFAEVECSGGYKTAKSRIRLSPAASVLQGKCYTSAPSVRTPGDGGLEIEPLLVSFGTSWQAQCQFKCVSYSGHDTLWRGSLRWPSGKETRGVSMRLARESSSLSWSSPGHQEAPSAAQVVQMLKWRRGENRRASQDLQEKCNVKKACLKLKHQATWITFRFHWVQKDRLRQMRPSGNTTMQKSDWKLAKKSSLSQPTLMSIGPPKRVSGRTPSVNTWQAFQLLTPGVRRSRWGSACVLGGNTTWGGTGLGVQSQPC